MAKYIAVLQRNIVLHTCMFNSFVSVRIVHLADRHTAGSLAEVISRINASTDRGCAIVIVGRGLFENHIYPTAKPSGDVLVGYASTILKPRFYLLSFVHQLFSSIATMPSDSTGFATDNNESRTAEFRVSANQPAPIVSINNVTSRRTNTLSPSPRITGSKIPASCFEAADMEPRNTFEEPNVCNAPLLPDLHAAWAHYAYANITWN